MPAGPPNLCPDRLRRSTPEGIDVDRQMPDGLCRIGVEAHARQPARDARPPRSVASCRSRGSRAAGSRPRCRAPAPPRRNDPGRPGRARRTRSSQPRTPRIRAARSMPPTAGCSIGARHDAMPGAATRVRDAPDPEGDRLRAAGRERDLVGLCPDRLGERRRGRLPARLARPGPGGGSSRGRRRCRGRRRRHRERRTPAAWRPPRPGTGRASEGQPTGGSGWGRRSRPHPGLRVTGSRSRDPGGTGTSSRRRR